MNLRELAILALAAAALAGCVSPSAYPRPDPDSARAGRIGGVVMNPAITIARNLSGASELTVLNRAASAAGFVETLDAAGPYTLFAPTDTAFGFIDAARLEQLLAPESRPRLAALLGMHVVPGRITAADILAAVETGGGQATYRTLAGDDLTFFANDGVIRIENPQRVRSSVIQANIAQSNGIVHILDAVLTQ